MKKSKVNGKWYHVDTLTLEEKVRLGFDDEVVEDLKKEDTKKKENLVKKEGKKRTKKKVD